MGEIVPFAGRPRRLRGLLTTRRIVAAIDEQARIDPPCDIEPADAEEIAEIWNRDPDFWPMRGNP